MDSPENKFFCGQLEACSSCPQGEVELNNSAKQTIWLNSQNSDVELKAWECGHGNQDFSNLVKWSWQKEVKST